MELFAARALFMDATYDMRGSRHAASATTMDTIITLRPDSRIIQGGSAAAHDLTRLRENNVDLLINCTTNIPNPLWYGEWNTPAVTNFPVCDAMVERRMDEGGSILSLLEPLFNEVRSCFAMGKNVMIHCRAGIHRAGTMGVILAMEFLNLNARDALRHVRKHRRNTCVMGRTSVGALSVCATGTLGRRRLANGRLQVLAF